MKDGTAGVDRRAFLKVAGVSATLSMGLPAASGAEAAGATTHDTAIIQAGDDIAVVSTGSGIVRGYISGGIQTFKGIPYGDSTAGDNRFMPPRTPAPWTNVRDCRAYGPTCPQPPRTGWRNDTQAFLFGWDDGYPGEDCLRANVWTPGLTGTRPVMVWLHGGGYFSGSSRELPSYDGENLSRRGDVVVVSVNHRVGVLGFLDLGAAGPDYAHSGNVGMLDLVAALAWVRGNIAAFGGDPGNVTIFGQSGGGGKVGALMAMPAAKGLFHKAIIQSGSELRYGAREGKQRLAETTLAKLGLTMDQAARLRDMPVERLIAAGAEAVASLAPPPGAIVDWPDRINWSPIVGGPDLPRQPFEPDAPPQSAGVPLLIGSTRAEIGNALKSPELETISFEGARKILIPLYGDRAGPIVDAYRAAFPAAKPVEILAYAQVPRTGAVRQAERKAAQPAPVYMYWFGWNTPVLDGRPRSFHASDLAFVFDNTDRCAAMTGGTPEARALAARMSDAWVAFARTGDPNHPGLPAWPRFDARRGALMLFDNEPVVLDDPDRAARRLTEV
jgi:para-nitrobenzyl esterase